MKNAIEKALGLASATNRDPVRTAKEVAPIMESKSLSPKLIKTSDLAALFDRAIANHLSLPEKDRIENSQRMEARVGNWIGANKQGQVKDLLGQNAKLMKSETGYGDESPVTLPDGRGVETTGLALSPAYQEGNFNTCPNHFSCVKECLGKTSGNYFKLGGGQDLSEFKGPRLNSLKKTLAFFRDPEAFAVKLYDEIQAAKEEAASNGNHLGVRLNVLSDIHPRIHKAIIMGHPDVTFYDYTKNNTNPIAPNHHYTYSSTGVSQPHGLNGNQGEVFNQHQNWPQVRRRLDTGSNVAMAFSHKRHLPKVVVDTETGKSYQVIDGDTHDFRPLDAQPNGKDGVIIGLRNKKATGKMNDVFKDSNGFFVHYDPREEMNADGTYKRTPSGQISPTTGRPVQGDTIPTNHTVFIASQGASNKVLNNEGKEVR